MDGENDSKSSPLENFKATLDKKVPTNFVIYLIRRYPLPKFVYYIVLIILLIQNYLYTILPLTHRNEFENYVPLLQLFSKIVLINPLMFNNFDFIRHIFFSYILYFILYCYLLATYRKEGVVKPFLGYLYIIIDTFLHTIFTPMIIFQCLLVINRFLELEMGSSDLILFGVTVLFINIFCCFKYVFINNFVLLSIHPTENILYIPYFIYFVLMPLFTSIGYVFNNTYYYLFPGTFSFIYGIIFFSKPYITCDFLRTMAFIISLTIGSSVYCYNFIADLVSESTVICINVAFGIFVAFIHKIIIFSIKKRAKIAIQSQDFVDEINSPTKAAQIYAYAAMQGCSQIFECIHAEALQRKFGENTMVSYYLCVSEMSLPHFPRTVVTKPSGYLKSDEVFCEIHQRMTNPCSKEDIISMHHICALDIYNCLKKCSDSLITITDLIFNESFNILSFNTLRSYDIFSECFQRIIVFMQMFPNSPYIDNISNIFLTICPSAYHKKEIEFWQKINYDGPFEKDNTYLNVTDGKSKYEYTSILKKSPNRTQKFKDIADDFSERKVDTFIERKGPYSYSRKGILLWFAFLGVLLIHIIFTYMIQHDYRIAVHSRNSLDESYYLLHQLANVTSFGPLIDILYNDSNIDQALYDTKTFDYLKDTINYLMQFFDNVRRFHFSIYNYDYFKTIYDKLSKQTVNGTDTTVYQQLYQNIIYLYETFLDSMGTNKQELNFSQQVYCGYVHNLNEFNSLFHDAINSYENYPIVILQYRPGMIILMHSCLYLFVLAIIIILFHAGYKREHSFYYELKKVSKSFLVKLKAFYKKVSESSLEIENQFILAKKNDETITKPIYLPFLSLVYLPTLLLFIFSVLTIVFSFSSMSCYVSSVKHTLECYGYLTDFELHMAKASLDSILTIRNRSCSTIEETLEGINKTLRMMSNRSNTKYGQSTPLCKLCYQNYSQIFSDSETLIEQESSIFLKLLSNVLISINNTNTSLSGATKTLIYNSFYKKNVNFIEDTMDEIAKAALTNDDNQPIVYFCFHFIFFILIIIYLVYIFMLQTHFDVPYFVLSLTLSNAKMINGNCTISDLIEESFDLSAKKEEKKLQNCTKEFCDKMTTPVMIIDCELKLLYSNDEASRIFLISKEFKDNLSLFEILKDGFIEEGTNKKIGQLINEFAYREFHTIRTYKILGSINSVSDHILTAKEKNMKINYELSIFPIYTTQKHFSQLILIFTPEAEFANYSNFLAKYRKLPITIRNEWIMKDFQITQLKKSNIIKETKSGIVAIVRVKTDFGEKAPQIIDQVFRRFDVIISQSKVFRYYRTHASMYCFGTDFSHEMEFTPYIIHKIILIIRNMFDEAGKVSLSKNVDVDAFSSVGFGNVIIGIPGKEHPFLEVWGAAITDALDMIKVAKLNKVMIRKRVLDQNNLSGIMPELVIPMK